MNRSIPSRLAVASIVFSWLMGSHCLSQPTREELAARIDAYLAGQAGAGQFSGSVLVADGEGIVISKGYAMANIELSVANTPVTKFRIGSVTKQFTAMAVMMLQERGLLNVQDPISMYWPDCPRAWPTIAIHHLLTHTSGIPNFTSLSQYDAFSRVPETVEKTIALFQNLPLRFTPGTSWEYSNSGYILLGYIIEAVTGQPYAEFVEENILVPLGMNNSGYDSTRTIITNRADGYARENSVLLNAVHMEMDVPYAAGALYSTVEDLYLWEQQFYTPTLVSPETLNAMVTPYSSGYGYGLSVGNAFNRLLISHSGGINGFAAWKGCFPEDKVGIVLLSNFEFAPIVDLGMGVAGIVKDVFDPLRAHWSLDETEGAIARDASRGNDAMVNGGPTWQPAAGKLGGALQLDGIDDCVATPFVLDPSKGPFSVFAWVKGGAPGQVVLSQADGANWLCADASGRLMAELSPPPGGRIKPSALSSEAVITDGMWHRVGLVSDGMHRILYVDDVQVAIDTQTTLAGAAGGLYIGTGNSLAPGSFWKGLVDDVRIYDQAVKP